MDRAIVRDLFPDRPVHFDVHDDSPVADPSRVRNEGNASLLRANFSVYWLRQNNCGLLSIT